MQFQLFFCIIYTASRDVLQEAITVNIALTRYATFETLLGWSLRKVNKIILTTARVHDSYECTSVVKPVTDYPGK